MKCLFAILISLMSVTTGAVRNYPMGCIPSTSEDWERAGVPLRCPSGDLLSSRLVQLSCGSGTGIAHLSLGAATVTVGLPDKKSLKHKMSDVQYQGDLGSCTCFSSAAAIEAQLTGIKISEAELYIRGKTEGGHDRQSDGLSLSALLSILSNGVLLSEYFPDYSTYEQYVINVLQNKHGASLSRDYDESIDHFRKYCRENIPQYYSGD